MTATPRQICLGYGQGGDAGRVKICVTVVKGKTMPESVIVTSRPIAGGVVRIGPEPEPPPPMTDAEAAAAAAAMKAAGPVIGPEVETSAAYVMARMGLLGKTTIDIGPRRELAARIQAAHAAAAKGIAARVAAVVAEAKAGPLWTAAANMSARLANVEKELAGLGDELAAARVGLVEALAEGANGKAAEKKLVDLEGRRERLKAALPPLRDIANAKRREAGAELRRRLAELRAAVAREGMATRRELFGRMAEALGPLLVELASYRGADPKFVDADVEAGKAERA
jgi:hypothetical protein